jgi:hypothetical protein
MSILYFAFACLRGFDSFEILALKTNGLRLKCAQNMPFTVEPGPTTAGLEGWWFALSARGTWEEKKITDPDF